MAKYRVLETSYIDERIVEAGEEINYTGLTGFNLQVLGDARQAEVAARTALLEEARGYGLTLEPNAPAAKIAQAIGDYKQRLMD